MFKVKVENLKQLDIAVSSKNVSEVILARDSFSENDLQKLIDKIKKNNKIAWVLLERISRYEEEMKNIGVNTKSVLGKQFTGQFSNFESLSRRDANRRDLHCMQLDLRTSTDEIFKIKNLDGIIIQNLDSFAYMLRKINKFANENLMVELNYTMNCYNCESKMLYERMYNKKRNNAIDVPLRFTAPLELNIYELAEVGYDTMILYSYIDTMVSANCLRKNISYANDVRIVREDGVGSKYYEPICKNRFKFNDVQDFNSYIIDRKGKRIFYKTYCKYCYNKIFNTEPLFLLDKIGEIKKHIFATNNEAIFRIDFSFENEKEVKNILQMKLPKSFTRGHFKNSIK